MKRLITLGAIGLAVAVAGCGRMADLEAPPTKQTERAMRGAGDEKLPDPATVYRRPMEAPIDGAGTNPYSGSGAYPDSRPR